MKPGVFGYIAPTSLDETLGELSRRGEDAKVLAGGQSLVALCNLRLARPAFLVDVNRVEELDYITITDDHIAVGAGARQRRVELAPDVATTCPLLPAAIRLVGHAVIRERGTLCGSLAHADPAAEIPALLVTLGGSVRLRSQITERVVAAPDFFQGFLTTTIHPDEMLVEALIPALPRGTGTAFEEFARRRGDFAIAGVACAALPDGSFRIGVCGAGPTPFRATGAEDAAAAGDPVGAGEMAARASEPVEDLQASADYRRSLVRTLTRRAIARAVGEREA